MLREIYYYFKYKKIHRYNSKDMEKYQYNQIRNMIDYAYNNFECYRKLYDERGVIPSDFEKISDLKKFPVIKKDNLKEEIKKISKYDNKYEWLHTTGSTGSPFEFPVDKISKSKRRATHLISYDLFGKKIWKRTGIFWRDVRSTRISKIKEFFLRRYWFSIYNTNLKKNILLDEDFKKFNEIILTKNIKQIDGYVSAIYRYAKTVEKYNLRIPELNFISVGGEVLNKNTKKYIEKIFNCKVYNRYGGSEISLIAHENSENKNKLEIMNFRLYLEILKNGEIVITDFTNKAIPFIRYSVGDFSKKINNKYIEYVSGRVNYEFNLGGNEYLNSHFFHKIFRSNKDINNFMVKQVKKKEFLVKLDCKNFEKNKKSIGKILEKQLPNIKFNISDNKNDKYKLGKNKHFIRL